MAKAEALALSSRLLVRRFGPGERIAAQGDSGRCLYLVRRGIVKLSSTSRQGRPAVLGLVGPGGVFGERALLALEAPSQAWAAPAATALTEGELSAIPLPARSPPGDALFLVAALASRLCETVSSLERVLHHGVMARLAGVLVELAERFGVPAEEGIPVPVALGQQELAAMVGTSRETVNRSISALRAMGWVEGVGSRLVIRDLASLRRFSEEGP